MAAYKRMIIVCLGLCACVSGRQVDAQDQDLPKVLIIGDSISGGYYKYLKPELEGVADVHRIPGNGEHTGTGLRKLDSWLGDTEWDVIHFNWGLWDLCYRNHESKGHSIRDKVNGKLTTTIEQYEQNLTELVRRLKKTDAKLIWAATTPVPEGEAGRIQGDAARYNAVAAKIMEANGIQINDLHSHIMSNQEKYLSKTGNVHFKREGYAFLAEKTAAEIRKALNAE